MQVNLLNEQHFVLFSHASMTEKGEESGCGEKQHPRGIPYDGLYGAALPERGTLFQDGGI